MLDGLYAAAAGMSAQQSELDAIGEDLANVSTPGYRSERVAFGELLHNAVDASGTQTNAGAGARAEVIGRSQAQGGIQQTGEPLDLAIEGDGYFQVKGAEGVQLTREGSFGVDASGTIVDAQGRQLQPPIKLPAGVPASKVEVAADGTVSIGRHTLGRIELATVTAPGGMLADGLGGFTPTAASGSPHSSSGARIVQGALEQSNVDMGREMTRMVETQRDFQMSSSAIQTESQMMSIANQLRPS